MALDKLIEFNNNIGITLGAMAIRIPKLFIKFSHFILALYRIKSLI